MNDTVAGCDISVDDGCSIDHDAVANGKGKRVSINRWSRHAIGHICCRHFSTQHMVEENIRQCSLSFRCVKVGKNNACVNERLVGWGKYRERSIALKGGQQSSLDDARNE